MSSQEYVLSVFVALIKAFFIMLIPIVAWFFIKSFMHLEFYIDVFDFTEWEKRGRFTYGICYFFVFVVAFINEVLYRKAGMYKRLKDLPSYDKYGLPEVEAKPMPENNKGLRR